MTISKGEPWGEVGLTPEDLVVVASDRELFEVLNRRTVPGVALPDLSPPDLPAIGLVGGDMARTVGASSGAKQWGFEVARLPIDLLDVEVDGQALRAAAHVVVGHRLIGGGWWRGELVAVMNAQFFREWDVAPRSHPNDGKFDLVRVGAEMSLRDRARARKRARTATHVPHPHIKATTATEVVLEYERPKCVWIDGTRWGMGRRISITIAPDATVVYV